MPAPSVTQVDIDLATLRKRLGDIYTQDNINAANAMADVMLSPVLREFYSPNNMASVGAVLIMSCLLEKLTVALYKK